MTVPQTRGQVHAKACDSRSRRYALLEYVREVSCRPGARVCMRALDRNVLISGTADGSAHLSGVRRCASPWSCPTCSPVIGETRAQNIDAAVTAWKASGGSVVFITATLSHKLGDDLSDLLELVQGAWSATFAFRTRPAWYGGQIRAVEVTHGRNGWHPHVHSAVFIRPGFSTAVIGDRVSKKGRALATRWSDAVRARGGSTDVTSERSPGWDVRQTFSTSGLGRYMNKVSDGWGVGLEIAKAGQKVARASGRTSWQLLDAAASGDTSALQLWRVFERATAGRQHIVWSPGLADQCGVNDHSDEEAVNVEPDAVVTVIAVIPAGEWRRLLRAGFAARVVNDVASLAGGHTHDWAWPPGWLLKVHRSSLLVA